jgi:LacI family transcriptional regulator
MIAENLGVHASTVSRALDPQQAHRISPELVQRIHAMVEHLNYEPNPWARSLRTNRSMTLGLVIPRLSDVVLAVIFEAANDRAREYGYQAVTVSTRDSPEEEARLIDHLLERRVDGIILATVRSRDPNLAELIHRRTPFILLNRSTGHHPCVRGDDELGGYLAARHLISNEHELIGAVAGPAEISTSASRIQGFKRAHDELGLKIDDSLIVPSYFDAQSGLLAGYSLLERSKPPTAVFAVNDMTALGVMAAARNLGLRIPEDLAIVGYNDSLVARFVSPPLSSVSLPLAQMGKRAVDLLISRLSGEQVNSTVFPPHLVVRASSDYRPRRDNH